MYRVRVHVISSLVCEWANEISETAMMKMTVLLLLKMTMKKMKKKMRQE